MKICMKKMTVLLCLCFLALTSAGKDADAGKYEAYSTINFHLSLYEFEKAEELIDRFLAIYPEDPFIMTEKAYILKNIKNKHRESLDLLKKALALYPDYYYANYLYAHLLFMYRTSGEALGLDIQGTLDDEALKYLQISIRNNDAYYDSYLLIGAVLGEKGEYEKSNEYLDKAVQLKGTPEPYFYIALNYSKLNNPLKELEAYEKILTYSPYNLNALTAISQYYLKQGDVKTAGIYLEKLFMKYPEDEKITGDYLYSLFAARDEDKFLEVSGSVDISHSPFLIFARAFFLVQKSRLDEAAGLLEPLKIKDLKVKLLLADIYKQRKDYYESYRILTGIDENEKNYLFYSLRLEVLYLLDMNRRILDVFDQLENNDDIIKEFTPRDYYNIISAHVNLNDVEGLKELMQFIKKKSGEKSEFLEDLALAIEQFSSVDTSIEIDKIKFDFNGYLLLTLYKNKKDYVNAVLLAEGMIKKEKSPAPYLELCDIYLKQGKKKEAETLLKEINTLFPASVDVKNFHAYFLAQEKKELEEALKMSGSTLSTDGESPAFLDTYGYILFQIGRTDEAAGFLEKAYRKLPFDEEVIEHLAAYYRLQKNPGKIIDIYRLAIDNGVDFKERLEEKLKELNDPAKRK